MRTEKTVYTEMLGWTEREADNVSQWIGLTEIEIFQETMRALQ